jgi:uncharacterized protein YwqG
MKWSRIVVIGLAAAIAIAIKFSMRSRTSSPPPPAQSYFSEGTHPTTTDLITKYRELGYGQVADALKAKAKPCFRLVADRSADTRLGSRVGGRPNLPEANLWPKYKGKSMAFLAQLNLNEIAEEAARGPLPARGMLYFFYDAEQSTWGFDPRDRDSWAILYRENLPAGTVPADYPADLSDEARYKSVPIKLRSEPSVPDPIEVLPGLSLSEKQEDEIVEIYSQYLEQASPRHQLLGYPQAIQDNEMEVDCQLTSHGLNTGDARGYNDPRAKRLKPGARNWRLLLQLDSDDAADMMWGDTGMLYFWITEISLKEKRFEDAWMILQCY